MSALLGEEKLPSVIQDPFAKNKIDKILIVFWPNGVITNAPPTCCGTVTFKNGNTSGEQSFKGESFDDVVVKMRAMINSME